MVADRENCSPMAEREAYRKPPNAQMRRKGRVCGEYWVMTDQVPLALLFVVGAYLLGTFPSAHLFAGRRGIDPTRAGSGNPGATNVYRTVGRRAGLYVFAVDFGKGAMAAGLGWVVLSRPWALFCWAAAVLGHVLPVTRRFRGGKGVATAGGGVFVLFPLVAVADLVLFAAAARLSRTASLGSIVMAVASPILIGALGGTGREVGVAVAISLLVLVRHEGNIRRLATGTEATWQGPDPGGEPDGSTG